jgi:hypothetical protein
MPCSCMLTSDSVEVRHGDGFEEYSMWDSIVSVIAQPVAMCLNYLLDFTLSARRPVPHVPAVTSEPAALFGISLGSSPRPAATLA